MRDIHDMDELTTTTDVRYQGHSFILVITKECDKLNLTKGDEVEVTIRVKKRYHD